MGGLRVLVRLRNRNQRSVDTRPDAAIASRAMKKLALLAAVGGITAGVLPGAATAGPDGVTVGKNGITIDTGIRCVTEPCPSHIVISIPPTKI